MTPTVSRNGELLEKRSQFVARGVAFTHPVFAERAEGARLWDADGREYLDFTCGIGVTNVGHRHPRVMRAIQDQLERFTHTCFQVTMYESYLELAERLARLAGPRGSYKTILLTTGVEAIENSVKIARAWTNRPGVLAFMGGFHGRTLLGTTLTSSSNTYRQNFGPFAPEVYHVPFPDEYHGWSTERALEALQQFFDTMVTPDRIAAAIIEPQLGEGGFVPAPPAFLQQLRRITSEHGIVLIVDEVQTGFGRTGKMFAYEHSGIEPDLIAMAKGIAGGVPLSAVVGKAAIVDAPLPGGLGSTYGGNPLACAAALAVLEVFEEENLVQRAARLGEQLRAGLRGLQQRFAHIGDVRGLGAMLAIELVEDRESKAPDAGAAQRLLDGARERGLLLLKCGPHKNVVRFLPPLIATAEDIERAIQITGDTLAGC